MTYPAKVIEQLGHDGPWGPSDCWIATTRGLIRFASNGKVSIDPETARKRSGQWTDNPTAKDLEELGPGNLSDIARVLRHPDTVAAFEKAGFRKPKVRVLGIVRAAVVLSYLAKGYQVAVAINYGTLRELRPRQSGSTTFTGGHSVRWYGDYDQGGKPQTSIGSPLFADQLDPLCDGRRPGIAKGPQRLNRKVLLQEAADCELHDANGKVIGTVGAGHVLALVVAPARPLEAEGAGSGGNPDPEPTDPCADAVAEANSDRDAALSEVGRLQGVIRQIGTVITDVPAAINAIATIVADPTNTGEVEQ